MVDIQRGAKEIRNWKIDLDSSKISIDSIAVHGNQMVLQNTSTLDQIYIRGAESSPPSASVTSEASNYAKKMKRKQKGCHLL